MCPTLCRVPLSVTNTASRPQKVVARIVGFWTHVSASSAFSAWAAQVEASKRDQQLAIVREETEALRAVTTRSESLKFSDLAESLKFFFFITLKPRVE